MIIALDARPLISHRVHGIEQHARNIVSQWAKLELAHEFILLCDRNPGTKEVPNERFISELPGNFHPIWSSNWHNRPWWVGTSRLSTLSRALKRTQVEIYHSFTPLLPRTRICPLVETIHDLSSVLDPAVRNSAASKLVRHQLEVGTQRAEHIVAVSTQTKNDIIHVYKVPPERISVIHNGIGPSFTSQADPVTQGLLRQRHGAMAPYILAVGGDIPRRNYQRLLPAMEAIWKTHPQMRLLVAGAGPWPESDLFKKAQQNGYLERILFQESPTDQELAQLYRDAMVTCCGSSFEGFGLSVLEAMACGSPVACSDMPANREVAEEAAVYFAHDDPQSIAQVLSGLIEDSGYRRQLRMRGLSRASLFGWPAAARQLLELLEKLTEKSSLRI